MTPKKTAQLEKKLLDDLAKAIQKVNGWGSVEIFIQNHRVTQITSRLIKKTRHRLSS